MLPPPDRPTGRRLPPSTVLIAAASAVVSALPPAVYASALVALTAGSLTALGLLAVGVSVGLALALVLGAVLLLVGRSWLTLVLCADVLAALAVAAYLAGDWAAGVQGFWLAAWVLPALTAVLAVLPTPRRWVAERRLRRVARRGEPQPVR